MTTHYERGGASALQRVRMEVNSLDRIFNAAGLAKGLLSHESSKRVQGGVSGSNLWYYLQRTACCHSSSAEDVFVGTADHGPIPLFGRIAEALMDQVTR